jgi:D-alanyl-D-alanine carboxypeptidase
MKTGFICASGFNLVASATRDNRRLIAVVLGAPSSAVRAIKAAKLLEQGFKGEKLSWLMPSLGTVDQLKPIEGVAPPDLRDEMCGPRRKRPAAEDEEVDLNQPGEENSPLAFMLSSLHGTVKASQVLAGAVASLPPVEVFVGAFRPSSAAAASAQEKQLAGGGPKKKAKGKPKTKSAAKSEAGSETAKADAKPATKHAAAKLDAKAEAPKPSAKPAKPKTAAAPSPAAPKQ